MTVSVLWVRMNSFIFLVPRMKTAIATLNQGFQTFKGAFMLMFAAMKHGIKLGSQQFMEIGNYYAKF